MGVNVFGTPITDETLKGMTEYYHKKPITQADRARVALQMKNVEGKDEKARRRAEEINRAFGDTPVIMVLIYNATGSPVKYVLDHDWKGHLCGSPYPTIIANGQWGISVHGKTWNTENLAKGAVVYAGYNSQGKEMDWLMSWSNNRKNSGDNRVFGEIREREHYRNRGILDHVQSKLLDSVSKRLVHEANESGGMLFTSIGNDTVAFFEAVMTLPDALTPKGA